MNDKIPPQSLDIERALLGEILIEADILDDVRAILSGAEFYDPHHLIIYNAMLKLNKAGKPIDILTVTEELRGNGKLDKIGGAAYLSQLMANIAGATHASYHAAIVREKFDRRELIRLSHETINRAYDEAIDLQDVFSQNYSNAVEVQSGLIGAKVGEDASVTVYTAIDQYYQREKARKEGGLAGIKTPLYKLDRLTGGWQNGNMIVIASRPSMGKTSFALHAAIAAGRAGHKPCIFSLEMTKDELAKKLILALSDIDPDRFKEDQLTDYEKNELEKSVRPLEGMTLTLEDKVFSLDEIHTRCRILKKREKLDLVIIDYLQLIHARKERGRSREQEITEISQRIKSMAKELDVPVIVLSQLNRKCEERNDKRPMLSDLRESGSIEQDADLVLMLYRDDYYGILADAKGESTEGVCELLCPKNRNGATKFMRFKHDPAWTRVEDYQTEPVI